MSGGLTIQRQVHFRQGRGSRKVLAKGTPPEPRAVEQGRVPRISRLMALAIRFNHLIKSGQVSDQADLARLGHVTRARVTQIMNLLNLAPDIQEGLLFLPRTIQGHDPIREHSLRPIAAILDWRKQRVVWKDMNVETTPSGCPASDYRDSPRPRRDVYLPVSVCQSPPEERQRQPLACIRGDTI